MAKVNWELVNAKFQRDRQRTGVTMAEWCEQHNYNYQTARRYLKCYSQLPAESETFQAGARNEQSNCAKTAQDGVKTAQEWNAQNNCAKPAQVETAQSLTVSEYRETKSRLSHSHADPVETQNNKPNGIGHDSKGRFVKGNPGNPDPPNQYQPRNKAAKKHAGYSKFFPDGKFDAAREMRLRDELILARTQLISVAESLQQIAIDLKSTTDPELRADLYRTMIKLQEVSDVRMARIESLTRTLSNVKLTEATVPYRVAETERSKVVARKGAVETRMMEREEGGDTTPIGDIISEIQTMGSGGLMSGPTGNETDNHG